MKISISRKVVCSRARGAQALWGSCPTSWNSREASHHGFWVRGRKRHGEAAEDAGLWVREGRANLEDNHNQLEHAFARHRSPFREVHGLEAVPCINGNG